MAMWFALHKCRTASGEYHVEQAKWDGASQDRWPTIYVFVLRTKADPYFNSKLLVQGLPALRVRRQECGVLGGAANLCRNFASRYISLKFRLAPGFKWKDARDPLWYFPRAGDDELLDRLLHGSVDWKSTRFPVTYMK
jgi:hypothetical protein